MAPFLTDGLDRTSDLANGIPRGVCGNQAEDVALVGCEALTNVSGAVAWVLQLDLFASLQLLKRLLAAHDGVPGWEGTWDSYHREQSENEERWKNFLPNQTYINAE